MEDEKKPEGEGAQPQDPAGKPQDTGAGEGAQPQDTGAGEGEGVNLHKLERDVANRDKRIKELEEQLAAAKGGTETIEARVAKMEEELAASKKALADEKVNGGLKALGCLNVKAARALLDDYEGDAAKLKEACPYLFGGTADRKPASTGGSPVGKPPADELDRLRKAAGLKADKQ